MHFCSCSAKEIYDAFTSIWCICVLWISETTDPSLWTFEQTQHPIELCDCNLRCAFWCLLSAPRWRWTSRIEWNDNQTQRLLPLFHSTCPGEFFLRVLIRCLFSHFSVRYSILCTSWRGRRILFRRFFAVFECLIHRYKHNIRIPLFLLKSESACLQYVRQYQTHTKHENCGR